MTREEFNATSFGPNMYCTYDGEKKAIVAVDFEQALLALTDEYNDTPVEEWRWVRCENVDLIASPAKLEIVK